MQWTKRFVRDEEGSLLAWIGGGMVAIVGIGAIGVDVGNLYLQETRLRVAADAAALAAARELSNGFPAVRDAAIEYTEKNLDPAHYGNVLTTQDVKQGQWDEDTGTFSLGGPDPNAVRVTLSRTQAKGNAVTNLFAGIIGQQVMEISITTIAARPDASGGCFLETGLIAGEKVSFGQDARINNGICIYGRDAVQFGQDPNVNPNAQIGALDVDTITWGQGSIPSEALVEADLEPELANSISQVLDDLEAGINLPSHITNVVVASNLPSGSLTPGTAYVIENAISINQDRTYTDVIIATRENISFGQDGAVRNSAGTCPNGEKAIGLYAVKSISIGQDARADGVQIVSGETTTIGQDLRSLKASIQAGKDLIIGQDPGFSGCGAAVNVGSGGAMATARLVR